MQVTFLTYAQVNAYYSFCMYHSAIHAYGLCVNAMYVGARTEQDTVTGYVRLTRVGTCISECLAQEQT